MLQTSLALYLGCRVHNHCTNEARHHSLLDSSLHLKHNIFLYYMAIGNFNMYYVFHAYLRYHTN